MGLTERDVVDTELQGKVLEWHKVLRQLRQHYADTAENPRERFVVGVALDADEQPNGIAVTSTPQPPLDDLTVRQTGAIAYGLSKLVDQRITERQESVHTAAAALSTDKLAELPAIDLAPPDAPDQAGVTAQNS